MADQVIARQSIDAVLKRSVILFDFDGVVIDSEGTSFEAWEKVFSDRGVLLTLKDWLPFVGVATGFSPVDLLERLSSRVQPDAQNAKDVLHANLTKDLPCRPGVLESIQTLAKRGVEFHIVSNGSRAYVEAHLDRLGLATYFSGIVSGREMRTSATKEALYIATCDNLGLRFRPTLVIEDSEHGIRAALASGLKVLGFPNSITVHQGLTALCPIVPYPSPLSADSLAAFFWDK